MLIRTFTFILLFSASLFAQRTSVTGTVTDSISGFPVSNADVVIMETGGKTITDGGGYFRFENLKQGTYNIKIYRVGYKSESVTVSTEQLPDVKISVRLSESGIKTGEISVTSTRFETLLKDVPMPMEIVPDYEIELKPINTLSDILGTKPGISLTRDGIWATDVSIRGLSRQSIVTLVDGNRIETATDLSARLSMIETADIEKVEVIKGGVSSLYGTGAFGGAVNIITKAGDFSGRYNYGVSLTGGYNSVNKSGSTWLSLNASAESWYLKLTGSYRNAGNTMTPKGELQNSRFSDNNVSASAGFKPFNTHEIRLTYQNYQANDVGLPGGYPLFPNNAVVKYPKEKRELYSAEYRIKDIFAPLKNISVKYFYQYILRDVENLPNQVSVKRTSSGRIQQKTYVDKISPVGRHFVNGLQFQSDWTLSRINNLIFGIDVWKRNFDSRRERFLRIENYDTTTNTVTGTINRIIGEKPIPESDYLSIGAYASDEMRFFGGKLRVTLGGRFDRISVTNALTYQPQYEITNGVRNNSPAGQKVIWNPEESSDYSWSGNIGAIYGVAEDLDATLNISRSFRSPNLEERYQYIDLGSILRVGNPRLSPEQGFFFDAGIRVWKQKYTFTGNVFYNSFADLVAEVPGTYEGRQALIKTNIGRARLYGYEFDFMYNFYRSFVGYASLSYVRGEDTENNTDLPQIPPLNGRIGVRFPLLNSVNFDISSVLFSEQKRTAQGEFGTPGYAVFNLGISTAGFRAGILRITVYGGVENILDKEYRNHLSTNRGTVTVEPGRNFYLKLKLDI